ncbi:MAG: ECF transporter S component [Candidatus Helarchaeota archaeon]|nr:ECF transporter S component [Candidatus Helarchaeota archaeon]
MEEKLNGKSRWQIGKESLIPLLIGIFAYLGLETLLVILGHPHQMYIVVYVAIFPAIAIPMVMGAKYGPIVGLLTGFGGKLLADLILYGGVWILWPIGFGLMGFITGLTYNNYYLGKYSKGSSLFRLSLLALLAAVVGTLVPTMLSIFTEELGLFLPLVFYFLPLFFTAIFNGMIFTPIIARGAEYIESKYSSAEPGEAAPSSPSITNQIGLFMAAFCYLMSFGLLVLNNLSSYGSHGSCCIGVPFGHEVTGSLLLILELGMYLFLGIGITLSLIVLVRWLNSYKKRSL